MKKDSSNSSVLVGNTKQPKQIAPAKHWTFTLNNWTVEEKDSILKICSNSSKKYIFQSEIGESGTPHLQGYIEFNNKCRPTSYGFSKRIHFEKCRNINASIDYCKKDDTSTGERWTNIRFPEPLKIITDLRPWQLMVKKILDKEPDDRSIYWFYDEIGNIGKSVFSKYIVYHYEALVLSGKANDCKFAIIKYNENRGYYPKHIIFDIPRSNHEYVSYEALESIKNGLFFCGKYESSQVIMNSPHVVVFANQPPDKTKMSLDRWKIKKIN